MRVAISGASGFIGRHVLTSLMQRGHHAIAMVRSSLPEGVAATEVRTVDILDQCSDPWSALGRPEALIHLAWGGLPQYASSHHLDVEFPAQCRFLEDLLRGGLPRLLIAGTCFEYGMVSGELDEGRDAAPVNAYGQAKDALHRHLRALRDSIGFDLIWTRLFYVFGPGQHSRTLLSQLTAAAQAGETEFPMSGGEQIRDYLAVEEAARIMVRLTEIGGNLGAVNICSGRPISVRELVRAEIEQRGWSIQPAYGRIPYSPHEPMSFWGSRAKLDGILGSHDG